MTAYLFLTVLAVLAAASVALNCWPTRERREYRDDPMNGWPPKTAETDDAQGEHDE